MYESAPPELPRAGGFVEDRKRRQPLADESGVVTDRSKGHWRLPTWELRTLESALPPPRWESPPERWYKNFDEHDKEEHRLDIWVRKHFDYGATRRKQVADALRNAGEGTWLRLPCSSSLVKAEDGGRSIQMISHHTDFENLMVTPPHCARD